MRFILNPNCNSGRLGVLSNISRLQGVEIETPHVFLYTVSGTVPHLTHEVFEMVTKQKLGLKIPVQSIAHIQEQIKLYKHSVADYIGMKEYLTYCSFINPLEKNLNNSYYKTKIGLNGRNGRVYFSPESYMEFIKHLKPDMFLLLSDGGTNAQSSGNRCKKSFHNSIAFFEKCMEIYKESVSLRSTEILGAIEGGFDLTLREQSSKLIGESSVFGVVIDGLHDYKETVSNITLLDIHTAIEASLKHVPVDKLRIIHGCWNPRTVLDLIELGIDMFDSSYISFITDQKGALIFPNSDDILEKYQCSGIKKKENNFPSNFNGTEINEPLSKKKKLTERSKFYISMLDPCYVTDFSPIIRNCTCLTCKNHTKAYVHHLVNVNELLGPTLLMIHNLHHYLLFLSTIRKTLRNGKFQNFKKSFQMWYDEISD